MAEDAQLLSDLKDLITTLEDTGKCENPEFRAVWIKKRKEVTEQIERLPQHRKNALDLAYRLWFEHRYKVRSTDLHMPADLK